MVAQTNQTDLLEAVEESPDEVCGTKETGCKRREGLGVGQYAQVVLWHIANSWILSTTLNNGTLRKLGWTCLGDVYH